MPSLRERNLIAVKKYYQNHHTDIMRRLILKRIAEGRQPRAATLAKYNIQL